MAPSTPTSTPASSGSFTPAVFKVPISFSLAGGWVVKHDLRSDVDLGRHENGAVEEGQDAGIQDIGSTTVAGATPSDPRMPWPTDVYAWLKSRPEFKPLSPQAITVGGRAATQIDADVNVPAGTSIAIVCSSDCWLLDHNDRWRFVEVKNADGSGVVWITNGPPGPGFDAYAKALDQLLGTLTFR
jgi:hypothetical protein